MTIIFHRHANLAKKCNKRKRFLFVHPPYPLRLSINCNAFHRLKRAMSFSLDNCWYSKKSETFDALKKKIDVVKIAVLVKIAASEFSENELNVIQASFAVVQQTVTTVESALRHYDVAIQTYKKMR